LTTLAICPRSKRSSSMKHFHAAVALAAWYLMVLTAEPFRSGLRMLLTPHSKT
jgi:hypothetical protein